MIVSSWLIAGTVMLVGIGLCGVAAWRRPTFEALVAMELAGTLATVTLVCLTVGFQQSSYGDVPIIAAVLNWVGCLVYVRFLDRSRA